MSKSILVLGTLLLMIHLSTSADPTSERQITFQDSSLTVTKKAQFIEFRMEIEKARSTPKDPSFLGVQMMLSLYSSDMALATDCHKDDPTDSENYLFNPKTNTDDSKVRTLDFGPFSVQGYDAKANSYIKDPNYWKSDKIVALLKCPSFFKSSKNMVGVLGLGYEGTAKDRFTTDKIKAFGIDLALQFIVFNPDTRIETRGEPRRHLKTTNANWQTVGSGKLSLNDEVVKTGDMALLFDVNLKRINFPKDLYDAFTAGITKLGLKTPEYFEKEGHESTANDLVKYPKISISIGDQTLVLEPEDYLEHVKGSVKRYNIELPLEGELQRADDLIYPVEEKYKKNVIVLGREFMAKYYTVFDISEGQITLYDSFSTKSAKDLNAKANKDAEEFQAKEAKEAKEAREKDEIDASEKAKLAKESKSAPLKWIAIVVVILIIVAVIGFFLWKKSQANKLSNQLNDQYRVAV